MKKLVTTFLCVCALMLAMPSFAQETFDVPANYAFSAPEDYDKHQAKAFQAITWLETIPLADWEKRQPVQNFVNAWVRSNPNIKVYPRMEFISFVNDDPTYIYGSDLMMVYYASMAKFAIENPNLVENEYNPQIAGVIAMLNAYVSLPEDDRSKSVDKILAKQQNNSLNEWVKTVLEQ